ncbi:hypothetical protein V3C99_018284 [Haemonchus contortus]|uniref:Uncharacterized protein n=1 Tax=Haemonchus contortus TaxID=6289 RepID=A0A7I4Z193_HAECO
MNIDPHEGLATRIGLLRMSRSGDSNVKIGQRRTAEELHIGAHGVEWDGQDKRLSEFHVDPHYPCYKTKVISFVALTKRSLRPEEQWRRSTRTSTLISSSARSTCLSSILGPDGYVASSNLPSEVRHAITSKRNGTTSGPDRIKAEHSKSLPPVIVETLARLFTRNLSECEVPVQRKISKTVLLYQKGDPDDIGNYRPICLLSILLTIKRFVCRCVVVSFCRHVCLSRNPLSMYIIFAWRECVKRGMGEK